MATKNRPPAQHLSFLAVAAQSVRRWGLFGLVRGAEARAPELPRIGHSRLPKQDVLTLSTTPSLIFAAPTVDRIEIDKGRARVSGHWMGLTGPMGALPIHLTEYAALEARYGKSRPFGRFLDLISGRMLQFFYRAWADSQPAASLDRPEEDRFGSYIAALTGATEKVPDRAVFPAAARLQYAALFASRRSAIAIQDALEHLMGQPVELQEFQPRWREIESEDLTRLGIGYAGLGQDAVLGSRVRTASDAFRVVIRARSWRDYEALLPGGTRFRVLSEALSAFAPSHLEWDITLQIGAELAPPARLDGRARLGWTGWLGRNQDQNILGDAHLRRAPANDMGGRQAA